MREVGRIGAGLVLLWLAGSPGLSYGEEGLTAQIGKKFVRGLANLTTGWAEVPKQIFRQTADGPYVLGTLQGIVEGVGMSFTRTSAGLYDLVTFPVPLPWHYRPLFEPEFVWEEAEPPEPGQDPPGQEPKAL